MRTILYLAIALLTIILTAVSIAKPTDKISKEGFWKIVKQDNIWWFRSPSGKLEFITAVQSVSPIQEGIDKPDFVSKDYHGDINDWAEKTAKRITNSGFNAVGPWSSIPIYEKLPYFKDLNLTKCVHLDISDPNWESAVEKEIKHQVAKDDHNLIGYFTDNEINWDINANNAQKYFQITGNLLKKYDPNHLNLGVRFNKRPPISVLEASKGFIDAHSVNMYYGAYKNMLKEINGICNVPVFVSEFSFFSNNNLSGDKNLNWPSGGFVKNRQARADSYTELVTGLSGCSFIIGTDWFQWNDEPPSGRKPDGEDLNCGIVSINDEPYPEMIINIQLSNNKVNKIHTNSNSYQTGTIWKQD